MGELPIPESIISCSILGANESAGCSRTVQGHNSLQFSTLTEGRLDGFFVLPKPDQELDPSLQGFFGSRMNMSLCQIFQSGMVIFLDISTLCHTHCILIYACRMNRKSRRGDI
jgi:hypothetical protein